MLNRLLRRKKRNLVTIKGISDSTHIRLKALSIGWEKPIHEIVLKMIEGQLDMPRVTRALKALEHRLEGSDSPIESRVITSYRPRGQKRRKRNCITIPDMPRSVQQRLRLLSIAWDRPIYVIVEEFILREIEVMRILHILRSWEKDRS